MPPPRKSPPCPGSGRSTPLGEELLVELDEKGDPRELVKALAAAGGLETFTRFIPDLENIFIRAVEEDLQHVG